MRESRILRLGIFVLTLLLYATPAAALHAIALLENRSDPDRAAESQRPAPGRWMRSDHSEVCG
jgi:hypothetical protein